jgi:hypothetical protein
MAMWNVKQERMHSGEVKATVYVFNGVPLSATELRDLAHELNCVADTIEASTKAGAFHTHLGTCARCEREPFNLCERGAELLRVAAGES